MSKLKEYTRLQVELLGLINRGLGDSEEADAVRDSMDGPWYSLTEKERKKFREMYLCQKKEDERIMNETANPEKK